MAIEYNSLLTIPLLGVAIACLMLEKGGYMVASGIRFRVMDI